MLWALAISGCRGTTPSETDEPTTHVHSSTWGCPPQNGIEYVEITCDSTGAHYRVDATAPSVGGGTLLQVGGLPDTTPWSDTVEMSVTLDDPVCGLTVVEAVLEVGVDPGNAVSGTSTPFTCADVDGGTLTFAAAVFDIPTDALVDCVVWGADPAGLIAGTLTGSAPPPFDVSGCRRIAP